MNNWLKNYANQLLKDLKKKSLFFNSMKLHSMRKPNKIWVDKGTEVCNSSIKQWLKDNDRTLKNKIYKHMKAVSKNMYIHQLDDIVNECNNTYQRTIKMKSVEVKDNTYVKDNT